MSEPFIDWRIGWRRLVVIGAAVAMVAAVVVVVLVLVDGGSSVEASYSPPPPEGSDGHFVLFEPAGDVGPNPFLSIVNREQSTGSTTSTGPATPIGDVGLYGGTLEQTCDQELLVRFLLENPDKGDAWAAVHGISLEEIANYVEALTAEILSIDTRVTNHGFVNGVATPRQSILAVGTAVLLDDKGIPRVRCFCGNPLGEPEDPGLTTTTDSRTTTTVPQTTTTRTPTTTTTVPQTTTTRALTTTTARTPTTTTTVPQTTTTRTPTTTTTVPQTTTTRAPTTTTTTSTTTTTTTSTTTTTTTTTPPTTTTRPTPCTTPTGGPCP